MELPFFTTSAAAGSSAAAATTRSEALRWLAIGEKLLAGRDLVGSKSFATRARESDPNLLYADQIIAVADTLLAGEKRINNTPDWYAVLQVSPQQTLTEELLSSQYRKLALLLNPTKNKLPYADQAFALIINAWQVLSNPSKKLIYDNELVSHFRPNQNPSPAGTGYNPFSPGIIREQHHQQPPPPQQQQFNYQPYEINFQVMQSQPPPQPPQPPLQPQPQHLHHAAMESREQQMFQQQQRAFREPPPSMMVPQLHLTPEAINQHTFQQQNVNRHRQVQQQQQPPAQSQPQPQPQPPAQYFRNEEITGNHVTHNLTHNFSGLFGGTSNNVNAMPNDDDNYNHDEDVIENDNGEDVGQENVGNGDIGEEGKGVEESPEDGGSSFWTACPYCYYMFEYPIKYENCALKCQNCKKVFQGIMIASPPPIVDGQDAYFCCWGMMPMGVSMNVVERNRGSGGNWTPFSPMFSCSKGNGSGGGNAGSWAGFGAWTNGAGGPSGGNFGNHNPGGGGGGGGGGYSGGRKNKNSGPRVYFDDDDVFLEYSDASEAEDDGDWRTEKMKKKAKSPKKAKGVHKKSATKVSGTPGKRGRGRPPKVNKVVDADVSGIENSVPEGVAVQEGAPAVEANKKGAAPVVRRHSARVAKEFGKLDLNVEFNNEGDEPAGPRVSQENGTGRGEEDIIEGSGFFEGLDEFLSSLPILNAVGDDKIKAA